MPVALVSEAWLLSSLPWSQVIELNNGAPSYSINPRRALSADAAVVGVIGITLVYLVFLSTKVSSAVLPLAPTTESPSQ
jgi:hypothetical protein